MVGIGPIKFLLFLLWSQYTVVTLPFCALTGNLNKYSNTSIFVTNSKISTCLQSKERYALKRCSLERGRTWAPVRGFSWRKRWMVKAGEALAIRAKIWTQTNREETEQDKNLNNLQDLKSFVASKSFLTHFNSKASKGRNERLSGIENTIFRSH